MTSTLKRRWRGKTPRRWKAVQAVALSVSGSCLTVLPILIGWAHAGLAVVTPVVAGFVLGAAVAAYAQLQTEPQTPAPHGTN